MRLRRTMATIAAPIRPMLRRDEPMTPGFLVVGTKRGGSTSIYHWIAQHPQVAPCRTRKGTHFFDVNHGRGESWFRSAFESRRHPWRVTGEGSPYYMFHPHSMLWIKETLPDVRLIAVLRDPVARAWSHHQYEVQNGRETLGFEAALDAEPRRTAGEEHLILLDPSHVSDEHRYHTYLARGRYAEQVVRILDHFPREQLLVLQSEALFADPHGQLQRVWDFLGLGQVRLDGLKPMKQGRGRSIPPSAVARLEEYYAPLNEQLYALPGIDFRWDALGGVA